MAGVCLCPSPRPAPRARQPASLLDHDGLTSLPPHQNATGGAIFRGRTDKGAAASDDRPTWWTTKRQMDDDSDEGQTINFWFFFSRIFSLAFFKRFISFLPHLAVAPLFSLSAFTTHRLFIYPCDADFSCFIIMSYIPSSNSFLLLFFTRLFFVVVRKAHYASIHPSIHPSDRSMRPFFFLSSHFSTDNGRNRRGKGRHHEHFGHCKET
jgi:hypothetical protein